METTVLLPDLLAARRPDRHPSPDAGGVARGADKAEPDPVVSIASVVPERVWSPLQVEPVGSDDVQETVLVKVPVRCGVAVSGVGIPQAHRGADLHEGAVSRVVIEAVGRVQGDAASDHIEIEIAVVVEVCRQDRAPGVGLLEPRGGGHVHEGAVAAVLEQVVAAGSLGGLEIVRIDRGEGAVAGDRAPEALVQLGPTV